jgi:hypothetical protein
MIVGAETQDASERSRARRALAMAFAIVASACSNTDRDKAPVPLTRPEDRSGAPVVRREVPSSNVERPPSTVNRAPVPPLAVNVPADAIYVCVSQADGHQKQVVIEFDAKVGALCRKAPEMGPCQYERETCRRSGGRVFAHDGSEITLAMEAEYDKKVMRVRFKGN